MKMLLILLKQLFQKPATNLFPVKYAPDSVIQVLDAVGHGKAKIVPPVKVPEGFRGKLIYDRDRCWECQKCITVCPTRAIEWVPEEKRVKIFMSRCCFCAQCTAICPGGVLHMSQEFLMSNYDKFSPEVIVTR
jgi:formate hydrogenlyase subunit 6/NADH:ubiquinone oxidoreductase subunit I